MLSYMLCIHGIIITLYLYFWGFPGNTDLLICYLVFFFFDGCPTIVLHLQYLAANRHTTLVVRDQLQTLSVCQDGVTSDYSFHDIAQVIYFAGYGNGAWYSFSEYRFFVLAFKDGKKVVISSLMMKYDKKMLERMFGKQVETRMGLFPWIKSKDLPGR